MRRLAVLLPVLFTFQVGASPALAWTWPVDGPVLRPFQFGDDPYAAGQHRGVDIGAPSGTPVRAPAGGAVTFAGSVPGGGRTVTIRTGEGYAVTLVHLGSIAVASSASVGEGETVGTVGPSGEPEVAQPYVHLGVRLADDPNGYVDPLALLPPRPAAPPQPPTSEPAAPEAPKAQPTETASPRPKAKRTRPRDVRSPVRAVSTVRARPAAAEEPSARRGTIGARRRVRETRAPSVPARARRTSLHSFEARLTTADAPPTRADASARGHGEEGAGSGPGPAAWLLAVAAVLAVGATAGLRVGVRTQAPRCRSGRRCAPGAPRPRATFRRRRRARAAC